MKSCEQISLILDFAQKWLGIKNPLFRESFEILSRDGTRWYGSYYPRSKKMCFNGSPSLFTIFHESVHFYQDERGMIFDCFIHLHKERRMKAYLDSEQEIEADLLAALMRRDFEVEKRRKDYRHNLFWSGKSKTFKDVGVKEVERFA